MRTHLDPRSSKPQRHEPTYEPWAEREFGPECVPDRRLHRRLIQMATQFGKHTNAAIPEACEAWPATKGAYRFFDNEAVASEALLASHQQATVERMRNHPVVLVPQDTTSLNFSSHPRTTGLGPIGDTVDGPQGLWLHHALALSQDGLPLGELYSKLWARDPADFHKSRHCPKRLLEEKESVKWLEGWQATVAAARQTPQTLVISVCDREGDVYEVMHEAALTDCPNVGLLVRLRYDRQVAAPEVEGAPEASLPRLVASWSAQPVAAILRVQVPQHAGQAARTAKLEVRFGAWELQPPAHKSYLPAWRVYAVQAREIKAPAGVEPICWQLLSTRPVTQVQAAIRLVQWYAQRWQIEVYHKVLKTGCQVERRQLETAARLGRMLAVYLVVAWRVLALTIAAREHSELPVSIWLEEAEWQTLACWAEPATGLPAQPPKVKEAVLWIAKLGGFLARKSDGQPGPICLWRGLRRLKDLTAGFILARSFISRKRCG
jgi:hypothetical protein